MIKIDLSGTLRLRSKNGGYSVSAKVPGDTHSALLAAKKIDDPFWADNELALQSLNREDWIYEREFNVSAKLLGETTVYHFESVDTLATGARSW